MLISAEELRKSYLLDPEIVFLNQGSFGATPKPVFDEYMRWNLEMERQPVEFLGRRIAGLLKTSREELGRYLNADPDDLVYVDNATWAVNIIARSYKLEPGDEILTTDHEYGACTMTWEWLAKKQGATMVRQAIPLPVTTHDDFIETFWAGVTPRTKVIFMSHITSPTALIFPIAEICRRAREAGILTVIDGAHAPSQLDLDMEAIGADIYTGNLHKWLTTPRGCAFMYVRREHHNWVESLIVSWGWGRGVIGESTMVQRNEWQGTRDHSAFLSVPAAIKFQADHDWPAVKVRCHDLAVRTQQRISDLTGLAPHCPSDQGWFEQLVACPIQTESLELLKTQLYDEARIEVPMVDWGGQQFVRVSVAGFTTEADIDCLLDGLKSYLQPTRT
jgi:isopenicillin-N epimerase